jgi:hypothetical protein
MKSHRILSPQPSQALLGRAEAGAWAELLALLPRHVVHLTRLAQFSGRQGTEAARGGWAGWVST